MVINHLEKLFVTSDASTIMSELEVEHPAAKLIVMAAAAQQQEIGDATNFVRACTGWQLPAMCLQCCPTAVSFERLQCLTSAGRLLLSLERREHSQHFRAAFCFMRILSAQLVLAGCCPFCKRLQCMASVGRLLAV